MGASCSYKKKEKQEFIVLGDQQKEKITAILNSMKTLDLDEESYQPYNPDFLPIIVVIKRSGKKISLLSAPQIISGKEIAEKNTINPRIKAKLKTIKQN